MLRQYHCLYKLIEQGKLASESPTVRSLNMKFHEFGNKNLPPILLIHGGGSSWWNYLRQARILSEEYRVILPRTATAMYQQDRRQILITKFMEFHI